MKKLEKEVLENHKRYLERKALFNRFGYDVDGERRFILETARPLAGNILEAGTGKGHFTLELARAGYRFTTFDVSETERDFAMLNLRYFGREGQVDFRVENGEALSFKDKSFDAIVSVNTLHHLSNPEKVLTEFLRVLKPGGKLVLSDFTPEGFALMDKIHQSEGRKHSSGSASLAGAERFLSGKGLKTETAGSRHQEVLTAFCQFKEKGIK